MNEKMAKRIRREARKQSSQRDLEILPELKQFINEQKFFDRIRICLRILTRKF